MPTMPANIAQGKIFRALSDFTHDKNQLIAALQALRDKPELSLTALAQQFGIIDSAQADHIDDHWLGAWWPEHQPVTYVIRQGLIQAFELCLKDPDTDADRHVPLEILWICSGEGFQLASASSAVQVTLLFMTPPPPTSLWDASFGPDEPIWITKHLAGTVVREDEQHQVATVRLDRPV